MQNKITEIQVTKNKITEIQVTKNKNKFLRLL